MTPLMADAVERPSCKPLVEKARRAFSTVDAGERKFPGVFLAFYLMCVHSIGGQLLQEARVK